MPKPPHFFQTHPFSCVPACLRMVLANYSFEISEFDLRNLCECDGTGIGPRKAIAAVKDLGFDCDEANLNFEELKEYLSNNLNPIVYLRFNLQTEFPHAVVVYKISKEKVFVLDPEIGEREFHIDNFVEIWSRGLTIVVEKRNS